MSERLAIPFIDLAAQRRRLADDIDRAIARVLEHGRFILGPEVGRLEEQLCRSSGARHAVACANGTDALVLALMALEIGDGDAVLVPSFTFSASAESVVLAGAVPVFVDVLEETFNLDPAGLDAGLEATRRAGLKPRAVMAVDLFGQPAAYGAIADVCEANDLVLVADAAQSFGGALPGRRVGVFGQVTTTSFFPSKPLGCYGDGGAVLTDSDDLAAVLRSLTVHGRGADKYDNVRIGMNSRLDSIQAAILLEKLKVFEEELEMRQTVAARYQAGLGDAVITPRIMHGARSAWALYTVRVADGRRDSLREELSEGGIPTGVYYPAPLHAQPAYAQYPRGGELAVSERLCSEVLSVPMHPYLDVADQDAIVEAIRLELGRQGEGHGT